MPTSDNPLAYVFWHWSRPDVPTESYEAKLLSFIEDLTSSRAPGLEEALSFRVGPFPWGPKRRTFYEDWYVIKNFSSLDVIGGAAVSGNAGKAHRTIVKDFMGGTGGIFRLVTGETKLRESRFVTWMDKARGTSYRSYLDEVAGLTARRKTDLWQRQLALGPSREFCVHSDGPLSIPVGIESSTSKFQLVC